MPASVRLTPAERVQRARLAAYTRWSREDPHAAAAKAQAGLLEKFRREVLADDPGVVEPELTRRAECGRRAHMQRLAFDREKARRARNAAQSPDDGEAA